MYQPLFIVQYIVLWCVLLPSTSVAHLFGLMLNNPIPLAHSSIEHAERIWYHSSAGATATSESDHANSASNPNAEESETNNGGKRNRTTVTLIRCRQDSDCIDDNGPDDNESLMYCDRHYGFCDYFRVAGELCRHDSQCDSGLICMFGACAPPSEAGHRGARCNDASDCNASLCCARQHGERICKPKLKLSQQCFVPLGGLDYSLNELCPCDEGLECKPVKAKNKRKRHFKSDNVMRCTSSKSAIDKLAS